VRKSRLGNFPMERAELPETKIARSRGLWRSRFKEIIRPVDSTKRPKREGSARLQIISLRTAGRRAKEAGDKNNLECRSHLQSCMSKLDAWFPLRPACFFC